MTLHALVVALGGDLYDGGTRANVPAPGHSAADRSVSLWLVDGRVIIHGFGGADWRPVRDDLCARGWIDPAGRLVGPGLGPAAPFRPDDRLRRETARRLWAATVPLIMGDPADRYLRGRAVETGSPADGLRLHPAAPVSVYRSGGSARPALTARIDDAEGRVTAVELTYLRPNGRPDRTLRLPRKTVGRIPAGAAVRLSPPAADMLVAEGVVTALSAMARFGLPGWALLAAGNLAAWRAPPGVRRVLIAADRGPVGEAAAERLRACLVRAGLEVAVAVPPAPWGDWNDVAAAEAEEREEEGL